MPRATRLASSSLAGAISNPLPPDDDQVQTWSRPGAAAGDDDAIGDHEGGIEADAELADQAGAVLGLGQAATERIWCRNARWCRDCRSVPAGPCRCRCRSPSAYWPSCPARCGFWAARRRRSDRDRRSPHSAACRRHPTRSKSVRAGKCRFPNRPNAPSGAAVRQPRPGTAGIWTAVSVSVVIIWARYRGWYGRSGNPHIARPLRGGKLLDDLRRENGTGDHTSSRRIHSVIERCRGVQPRISVAAVPRTRLLEPSENVAFSRPQASIAARPARTAPRRDRT